MPERELRTSDSIYDISTKAGFYSLLANIHAGETGYVYSFGPFPGNLRKLKRHLEINRIKKCFVFGAAVSSVDGETAFDSPADRCTNNLAAIRILRVQTPTLEGPILEKGIRSPGLMKTEARGAHYECLWGAGEAIQKSRSVIFVVEFGGEVYASLLRLLAKWNCRVQSLDVRPA